MNRLPLTGAWFALLGAAMVTPGCAMPSEHVALTSLGTLDDQALAQRLGLGPEGGLSPQSAAAPSAHGTTMQRAQQMHHGIPVYGRSVVIERDARGGIVSVRGELARGLPSQLDRSAVKISPQQAVDALREHLGLATGDLDAGSIRHPLYIDPRGDAPKLAYLVSFFATHDGHPQRPTAMVDATDGHLIEVWQGLTTQDQDASPAQGSRGHGGFVGPRPSGKDGDAKD